MLKQIAVLAGVVTVGLALLASTASSQDQGPTRPSLSDRLDQFRRNLMGDRDDRDGRPRPMPSAPRANVGATDDVPFTPRPEMPRPPASATNSAASLRPATPSQPAAKPLATATTATAAPSSRRSASTYGPVTLEGAAVISDEPAVRSSAPVATTAQLPSSRRSQPAVTPAPRTISSGDAPLPARPVPTFDEELPSEPRTVKLPPRESKPAAPATTTVPSVARATRPEPLPTTETEQPAAAVNVPAQTPAAVAPPPRTLPATPAPSSVASTTSSANGSEGVLFVRRSPEVSVQTVGPRRISVGKPATYKVELKNSGDLPAANVEVTVKLPAWAEVLESFGSTGHTHAGRDLEREGIRWTVDSLPAASHQELTIKVVARRSETFNLGVQWTCSPAASQAAIEVQEPKLAMAIQGPRDVEFGSQHVYKITISNPGSGVAENVIIHLLPLVPGESSTASQPLGDLKAGDSKVIEVELTARQAGKLSINAEVTAEGDLRTTANEEVTVRRAALTVAMSGPKLHFAGLPAAFEVVVRNTGDAPARDVRLAAAMPRDGEFLEATGAGKHDERTNQVVWTLPEIAPGAEHTFQVRCVLKSSGLQRVAAAATGNDDLKSAAEVATQVMARADLAMSVVDQPGPIPVGQDVVYEIHIRNRGTKSAEGVEVVTFFSEGIDPVAVEGAEAQLSPGIAEVKAIPTIAAGEERVLKVKARAQATGSHRFRVELECPSLGTKLTHENTTFFYGDDMTMEQ